MTTENFDQAINEWLNNEWIQAETSELAKYLQGRGLSLEGGALVMSKMLTLALASIALKPTQTEDAH